jgi:hypothetical protein
MKRLSWAIILLAAPAFGQTAIIGSEVGVGAISTAFEAPPSGDFGEGRQSVAMLLPGERFRLAERRVVSEEEWVRLEAIDSAAPCARSACWIFNRRLGSAQSALSTSGGLF